MGIFDLNRPEASEPTKKNQSRKKLKYVAAVAALVGMAIYFGCPSQNSKNDPLTLKLSYTNTDDAYTLRY